MITRGIIKKVFTENNANHYNVYIPLLRSVCDTVEDATYDAVGIYHKGIISEYQVDDAVYVGFIDDQWGSPVVLGLVCEDDEGANLKVKTLEVNEKAVLPNGTLIGSTNQTKVNRAVNELVDDKIYNKEEE